MTQPNPYATPETELAARERGLAVRPALAWFGLGGALIAVGVVVAVVMAVPFFQDIVRSPTVAPGRDFTLQLEAGEKEALYVDDAVADEFSTCRVEGGGGLYVLGGDEGGWTTDSGDRSWFLLGGFTPRVSGEYDVSCTSSSPAAFAYGPHPFQSAGRLGTGIVLGVLLVPSGVAVCIIVGVRRSHAKQRALGVNAWGAPRPAWAGGGQWGQGPPQAFDCVPPKPPTPQWGQPQWGQPQWGQPQGAAPAGAPPPAQPVLQPGEDPWATPPS